jgi:uncharacterized membrane protein YkvA (DUF1232 family)
MRIDPVVWWCVAGLLVAATALVVVRLSIRLVRARRLVGSAGLPLSTRMGFWAAVAYVVMPFDLLPDPVLLDDIGVLLLALRALDRAAARAGVVRPRRHRT